MNEIVNWYVQHKDLIDLLKDIVFVIGATATFVGFYQLIKLLVQRKTLNKRQEMDNDARLYSEVNDKLREYVKGYDLKPNQLRDVGIRLLYIKNYPYKLDNDGFRQELYYYFFTEIHQPSGYISGKGLYVVDFIHHFSDSIYYNPKNGKWFISKEGRKFRRYKELSLQHLVKRIPFANILGYDFNSDWADKGEPVFYTKYKYTSWRLFADEIEALTWKDGQYSTDRLTLQKSKRARRIRTFFIRTKNRINGYFLEKKTQKLLKQEQAKWRSKTK